MNAKTQNIVAVIIGLIVITAIGAMMIPLIEGLLANFYSFSMQKGFSAKTSIYVFAFLFVAIPSFISGYITSWIAVTRKIFAALLMGVFAFAILVAVGTAIGGVDMASTLTALAIIPLAIMGGIVRKIIENKKEIENY